MDTEESNEYIFFRLFFSSLSLAGNMSPEVWKGEEGRGARGNRSRRRGTEGRREGFIKGQQRGKVNISQELEVVIFSRRFQIRSPTQKVLRTVITYWQALSAGCGTCVLSVIVIFFSFFPPFSFTFLFSFLSDLTPVLWSLPLQEVISRVQFEFAISCKFILLSR